MNEYIVRRNEIHATTANTFAQCPRRYFYAYELGWVPEVESRAFTVGKAWHRLLELSAQKVKDPLQQMLDEEQDTLTEEEAAVLIGMYSAFAELYQMPECRTEQPFRVKVPGTSWHLSGHIDGITPTGEVVEYKTTSDSVEPDSDYWARLGFNLQVLLYSMAINHDAHAAHYFVMRKPSIKPKQVPILDADGKKVVLDKITGKRVYNKNGTPRLTGGDGMEVQMRIETADEYADRLYHDVLDRPDFYFAEKEVLISQGKMQEALADVTSIIREVQMFRRNAKKLQRRQDGWRRACSEMNCAHCPYRVLCLDTDYSTEDGVPDGFRLRNEKPKKEQDA